MKRLLSLALACLAVLSLAACGSKKSDSDTMNEGKLLVGTEIGYPPFEQFEDDGVTPTGLDIELAKEIASILGLEVEFVNTGFDGILAGLAAGNYDVVMSALTITAERAQEVDFSDPYVESWQAIAVRTDSDPITSMAELEGKKVAYQEGTTSKEYISLFIDKGELTCEEAEYPKILNCFDELKLGRVDAVLCDSVVAEKYASDDPETFTVSWIQSSEDGEEPELFGIAVKKGNSSLLTKINEALKTLEENGKLDELRDKWLAGSAE